MIVFGVSTVVIAYVAFRGGAYDAVVRQEAGLVLCAALALGLLFGVLPRARIEVLSLVPLAGLAALALLTLASLSGSATDERAFTELSRVCLFAAVMALPILGLNRYTWRAAAAGISVAAIAVTLYAVLTRIAPGAFGNDSVLPGDRLSYPLDYWNGVGAWAAAAAVMGLSWSAHLNVRWIRGLALASVPVSILCVYLTYSRGGWVELALGALAVIVVGRNRWTTLVHLIAGIGGAAVAVAVARGNPEIVHGTGGAGGGTVLLALAASGLVCAAVASATLETGLDRTNLPRTLVRWVVPATLITSAAIFFAAGGAGLIEDGWDEFNGDTAPVAGGDPAARLPSVASTRSEVWDVAYDAFADEPLTGIGPGTFETYWSQHSINEDYLRDAHSLYYEQLAELGLLGFAAILVAIGGGLALGIRARARMMRSVDVGAATAMIATGLVFAVSAGIDWMWELTAVTVLGLGAIGVLLAAEAERVKRAHLRPLIRAGAVLLAVLAAASQVPGLVSTARERESTDALENGETARALELADEAIDAEPWSSTAYLQRAAVHVADGRFGDAEADAGEAIERDPEAWRPWFALTQIELARGDEAGAERAFRKLQNYSVDTAAPYVALTQLEDDEALTVAFADGCLARTVGNCF
jgi:hypothetical protein